MCFFVMCFFGGSSVYSVSFLFHINAYHHNQLRFPVYIFAFGFKLDSATLSYLLHPLNPLSICFQKAIGNILFFGAFPFLIGFQRTIMFFNPFSAVRNMRLNCLVDANVF